LTLNGVTYCNVGAKPAIDLFLLHPFADQLIPNDHYWPIFQGFFAYIVVASALHWQIVVSGIEDGENGL